MRKAFVLCLLCLYAGVHAIPSYFKYVETASKKTGVPVYIIMGVIMAESGGDPQAISPFRPDGHRDEGIMQLNTKYLDYFSWKFYNSKKINTFSAMDSIYVGTEILAFNYRYFHNWVEALASYRQGIYGYVTKGMFHSSFVYIENIFVYGSPYRRRGE